MKKRTMAEVRAECAELGITPARSIAESEQRIAERKAHLNRLAATAAEDDRQQPECAAADEVLQQPECAAADEVLQQPECALVKDAPRQDCEKRRRRKRISNRMRVEMKRRARQARMAHKARKEAA